MSDNPVAIEKKLFIEREVLTTKRAELEEITRQLDLLRKEFPLVGNQISQFQRFIDDEKVALASFKKQQEVCLRLELENEYLSRNSNKPESARSAEVDQKRQTYQEYIRKRQPERVAETAPGPEKERGAEPEVDDF
jgi:hypothetical protein